MLYDRMILDELAALMGMKPVSKRNKFRAKPTVIDGIRFASRAEAARYLVLQDMERTGEISSLELQPEYDLPGGIKYVADFCYFKKVRAGKQVTLQPVTEDVKGFKTAVYKLKAKLFKEKYGRAIVETQLGSGAVDMLLKAYAGQQRREQPAPVPEGIWGLTTATAVKERPILFTGSMVRALLEGRKTQTRRVVKPQPNDSDVPDRINCEMYCPIVIRRGLEEPGPEQYGFWSDDADWKCPYGQPGDRLWVRETWAYEGPDGLSGLGYQYKADGAWLPVAKWKPSIHMHRAASRITLEITGVRVERVKDISEADAVAEGFSAGYGPKSTAGVSALWSARDRFLDLFYNLRKRASPNENPWVWVLEFKRVPQDGEAAREEA